MLIFCPQESVRLTYILNELLVRRLGIQYTLTDNETYFSKSLSVKLNYSNNIFPNCVNVPLHGLLFEQGIFGQKIQVKEQQNWFKVFFDIVLEVPVTMHEKHSLLPFDLFAASFYLLSRYEEVSTHHQTDKYGRFSSANALAVQEKFIQIPLVDYWVNQLKLILNTHYPQLQFAPHQTKILNTIDIDFAYKYRGLSLYARIKKSIGSIWRHQPKQIIKVWFQPQIDPYDTYAEMLATASSTANETLFFVLMATGKKYDQNIRLDSPELSQLLNSLSNSYPIGIHPSIQSHRFPKKLQTEINLLSAIIQQSPSISRQHFLKFKWPDTYQKLAEAGIKHDYSMAYSDCLGFRASTVLPFLAFDLKNNCELPITVHSPCVMDVCLKNSLKLTPEEAINEIKRLKMIVREHAGEMISIWHNSSFDEEEGWTDWHLVYQSLFSK